MVVDDKTTAEGDHSSERIIQWDGEMPDKRELMQADYVEKDGQLYEIIFDDYRGQHLLKNTEADGSSSDEESPSTMHCGGCGCEEYNIKFEVGGDAWAECAGCGRPTSVFGIGEQKQRAWELQNE